MGTQPSRIQLDNETDRVSDRPQHQHSPKSDESDKLHKTPITSNQLSTDKEQTSNKPIRNRVGPRPPFGPPIRKSSNTKPKPELSARKSAFLQVGVRRRLRRRTEPTGKQNTTTTTNAQVLLRSGPGLLDRAQKARETLTGCHVTTGEVTELFTAEEQAAKAVDRRTSGRISYLLQAPFNRMAHVEPYLGLTGVGGLVVERLAEFSLPVRCLFNVTYEAPLFRLPAVHTFRVPVADHKAEDLSVYFDAVADKLEQVRVADGAAVVHCMGGVSRSATLVIAYLMRHQDRSLEAAFRQVKRVRTIVRPNLSFLEQLGRYEARLRPSTATDWREHTQNGVTRRLPVFIIEDYLDEYHHEFQ